MPAARLNTLGNIELFHMLPMNVAIGGWMLIFALVLHIGHN